MRPLGKVIIFCDRQTDRTSLLYKDLSIVFHDEYQSREKNTRWAGVEHLILANCPAVFLSYFKFVMKDKYKDQIVHQVGWGRAPDPDSGLLNPRDVDWQDSVFM